MKRFLGMVGLLLAAPSAFGAAGLRVKCNMDGASVYLDGKAQGGCPAKLFLSAGQHRLVVEKAGSGDTVHRYQQDMHLGDGEIYTVDANLSATVTEDGLYRRGNDDAYMQSYPNGKYARAIQEKRRQGAGWKAAFNAQVAASGTVFRDCPDCPEMVVIPPGNFVKGSTDPEAYRSEWPPHAVTITQPFALGKNDVTVGQYTACIEAGGCRPPVWLEKGSNYNDEYDYNHCGAKTGIYRENATQVGSFPPNGFNLHDMVGNVWQWLADCYQKSYSGAPVDGSAWMGAECAEGCVMRGDSWAGGPRFARSANRNWTDPLDRNTDLGFRPARMLP